MSTHTKTKDPWLNNLGPVDPKKVAVALAEIGLDVGDVMTFLAAPPSNVIVLGKYSVRKATA